MLEWNSVGEDEVIRSYLSYFDNKKSRVSPTYLVILSLPGVLKNFSILYIAGSISIISTLLTLSSFNIVDTVFPVPAPKTSALLGSWVLRTMGRIPMSFCVFRFDSEGPFSIGMERVSTPLTIRYLV